MFLVFARRGRGFPGSHDLPDLLRSFTDVFSDIKAAPVQQNLLDRPTGETLTEPNLVPLPVSPQTNMAAGSADERRTIR